MTPTVNCWICYCSFVYGCVFVLRRAENKMLLWFLVQSFGEKKMSSTITSSHFEFKKSRSHKRKHSDRMERERDGERKMKVMVTQRLYQWNVRSCRSDQFRPSRAVASRVGIKKEKRCRQEWEENVAPRVVFLSVTVTSPASRSSYRWCPR